MSLSILFFFFKIVLASLDPLHFLMNFGIHLSVSTQKAVGVLTGAELSLWVIWVISVLSLPQTH